jgi:hypothetical protein
LLSNAITKVDFSLAKNISVTWRDLHFEIRLLADTGLWAKLFLEERHPKAPHGNLPLKFSVKEILGVRFQRPEKAICGPSSGPTSKHNVRLSTYPQGPRVTYVSDAGLDAVISLRLFNTLIIPLV